jgi:hypothetical protein
MSIALFFRFLLTSFCRVPDLALVAQHPKRAFIRRVVEFEVRLAYHDRILKTLPPQMQEPEACVITESAPSPAYEYEDPCKFTKLPFSSCAALN